MLLLLGVELGDFTPLCSGFRMRVSAASFARGMPAVVCLRRLMFVMPS